MSAIAELLHTLAVHCGISRSDLAPAAIAALVAADRGLKRHDRVFQELALLLSPRDAADARLRAREWLQDELSQDHVHAILARWPNAEPGSVDWTAELETLVDVMRNRGPFVPISPKTGAAFADALMIPENESVACLYAGSATIAWALAGARPATLHVTQWETEIIMALLEFADGRPLRVDRRNPLEMVPIAGSGFQLREEHSPRPGNYDHLVAVPPVGARLRDGAAAGMLFEAWQVGQLAPRAGKSLVSLATDGPLFRESKAEVEFRRRLAETTRLTVTSLPPGMFGRAYGVQVNMLKVERGAGGVVRFVDGRSMERVSRSGREQEDLVVRQLEKLADAPEAMVRPEDLAANNFNLLPSRYVVPGELARLEQVLASRPTARLGDLARIVRPRAPQPNRSDPADDDCIAMEIAVSDIVEGKVGRPSKEIRFPARERSSVNKVQVAGDDILVSIKGNVGVVGITDLSADLDDLHGTPQVISQSLAIVRPRLGGAIRSPRVIAAILGSPQMRAKLQAMAGGTTVPTLSISVLQDLPIPVPGLEEALEIESNLDDLDAMQKQIDDRAANRRMLQKLLWQKIWDLPPGPGSSG